MDKVANPTPFDTVLRKILHTTQKTMLISEIRDSEFAKILETTGSDMQTFVTAHCYGGKTVLYKPS